MTRDRRIWLLVIGAALPGALVALSMLWTHTHSAAVRWTLAFVIVASALGCAAALQAQVVRPLQTLSNMLSAIREGDYTQRGRFAFDEDSFGLALREANAMPRRCAGSASIRWRRARSSGR